MTYTKWLLIAPEFYNKIQLINIIKTLDASIVDTLTNAQMSP